MGTIIGFLLIVILAAVAIRLAWPLIAWLALIAFLLVVVIIGWCAMIAVAIWALCVWVVEWFGSMAYRFGRRQA